MKLKISMVGAERAPQGIIAKKGREERLSRNKKDDVIRDRKYADLSS